MDNRKIVSSFIHSLNSGDLQQTLTHISEKGFVENHSLLSANYTTAGEMFGKLISKGINMEIVRLLVDNHFVVTHSLIHIDKQKMVSFDIFEIQDEQIQAHWGNASPLAAPNPSGHTQLDGETKVSDLAHTEQNKRLINSFIHDEMMQEKPGTILSFFDGNHYIQHNSGIADGIDTVIKMRDSMTVTPTYTNFTFLLGEGNFVLAVTESPSEKNTLLLYDLFRIENNKIAEHWDIISAY